MDQAERSSTGGYGRKVSADASVREMSIASTCRSSSRLGLRSAAKASIEKHGRTRISTNIPWRNRGIRTALNIGVLPRFSIYVPQDPDPGGRLQSLILRGTRKRTGNRGWGKQCPEAAGEFQEG